MALTQISTQGIKDGTITGTDIASNLDLADNQRLRIGTGNDLQLWHDSGYNFIDAVSGVAGFYIRGRNNTIFQQPQLKIRNDANTEDIAKFIENGAVELYYDNSKKFETTSDGATVTGSLTVTDDISLQDDLLMGDTDAIKLGNGADLQLFHDGSESYVKNANASSNLILESAHGVHIKHGGENMARFIQDGGVELMYDNSKKFETTSTGVTITGKTTFTDDLSGGDNIVLRLGSATNGDLQIYHNGSHSYVADNGAGELRLASFNGSGVRITKSDSETLANFANDGAVELYYDNIKSLETTTEGIEIKKTASSQTARLKIEATNGGQAGIELRTSLSGTNRAARIDMYNQDTLQWSIFNDYQQNGTNDLSIRHGAEKAICAFPDGGIELYYDNSKKFETISSGSKVTGRLGVGINPNRALHVSQTSGLGTVGVGAFENGDSSNNNAVMFFSTVRDGNAGESFLQCNRDQDNNGQGVAAVAFIRTNGDFDSATNSYGGTSDITLKENIVDAKSQWDDIKNIKVRNFNFKDNPDQKMLGVVAQEIETVCSGLVKETSDEGTTLKTVKYSILYMKAIKCLQEAMAKIEVLETEVAALKAG